MGCGERLFFVELKLWSDTTAEPDPIRSSYRLGMLVGTPWTGGTRGRGELLLRKNTSRNRPGLDERMASLASRVLTGSGRSYVAVRGAV